MTGIVAQPPRQGSFALFAQGGARRRLGRRLHRTSRGARPVLPPCLGSWARHDVTRLSVEGGSEVFFLGVIDFLIAYGLGKAGEHVLRTAQGHAEDLSAS